MKYGKSKYNTIKYGKYIVLENDNIFSLVRRVRIRTRYETNLSKTISIPICRKVRVNGMIACTFTINGCYNKMRISGNLNKEYNIAEVVKV